MRQCPHPERPDESRIGEGGDRHHAGESGENGRKPDAKTIDADENLLRRVDETEESAEEGGRRERIEQRQPVRQHDAEARKYGRGREGAPVGVSQSLPKAQGDRKPYGNREQSDHDEDHVPLGKEHDQLSDARCDDRDDHEYHHHQRHDLGHLPPAIDIAHDGNGDDTGCSRAYALHEPKEQECPEGRYEHDRKSADAVKCQPAQQWCPSPEAIGQRAEEELREPHAEQVGGYDVLPMVLIRHAEARADFLQPRQHDVDRDRVDGHQHGHQCNELDFRQSGDGGGLVYGPCHFIHPAGCSFPAAGSSPRRASAWHVSQ